MNASRFYGNNGKAALFLLRASRPPLEAAGCRSRLPAGPVATAGERVKAFLAESRSGAGGAGRRPPFDPYAGDVAPALAGGIAAEPSAAAYADTVARTLAMCRAREADPRARGAQPPRVPHFEV